MTARLNSRMVKPVYFPNFFNIVPTEALKWESLYGEKGVPVAADVISYDASAPIKTREVINKAVGDIPKIAISRVMSEQDWNKYRMLMYYANGDQNKRELLDLVFNDLDFCYNGVRARMEWMAMQILSSAALSLSKTTNNGRVTETALDFAVPTANKYGVTVNWATSASATPLEDLEDLAETAANTYGVTLKYFVMRRSDFLELRNADDTTTKIKAWINSTGTLLVTLDVINQYMTANGLPNIIVVNPSVRLEDEDHARTVVNPWTQYRVVGIPDLNVGSVQHGPIAIESSAEVQKKATLVKKDFVLNYKYAQLNPFGEVTVSEANAFPVLNDPDALFYLRTNNATWAD